MTERNLDTEFAFIRDRLIGLRATDDRGPVVSIEDVVIVERGPNVIVGRVRYVDHRTPGRPTRTSDFSYGVTDRDGEGPQAAVDMLVADLEEEVLARD